MVSALSPSTLALHLNTCLARGREQKHSFPLDLRQAAQNLQ